MQKIELKIPKEAFFFVEKWLENHHCQVILSPDRRSKLGDYRLLPDGSHQITINSGLNEEFFFFVLTHEIAHLLAFHQNRRILPHGKEWKSTFRNLILETIFVYSEKLQPLLKEFSKNPKANFMSAPTLVKYFDNRPDDDSFYVEDLQVGDQFIYQSEAYQVEEKKKKRYLCKNLSTGRQYYFRTCAKIEKNE